MIDSNSRDEAKKEREWYIEKGMNITFGVGIIVLAKAIGAGPVVRSIFANPSQSSSAVQLIGSIAVGIFYDFYPAVFVIWLFGLYLLTRSFVISGTYPSERWWNIDIWIGRLAIVLVLLFIIQAVI